MITTLTEEKIREAVKLYQTGMKAQDIANKLGIENGSTISMTISKLRGLGASIKRPDRHGIDFKKLADEYKD